jgi:hypothetical protein
MVPARYRTVARTAKRAASALKRCNNYIQYRREIGAGEAIRTLDPNLGKVVLYP